MKEVYDSLYKHVRNAISGSQHGFVRCISIVFNLVCYTWTPFLNLLATRNKLILFTWTSVKPVIQCAIHCYFTSLNRMGILGNACNVCSPTFSTENNVWYSKTKHLTGSRCCPVYHKVHRLAHFCLSCISMTH